MTGKSHLAFGLITGAAAGIGDFIFMDTAIADAMQQTLHIQAEDPSPVTVVLCMAACAFGALLPDIDNPTSRVGRRIKPVSYLINKVFGHRGFTHAPFCLLLLLLASSFLLHLPYYFYISSGFAIGYLGHIYLDMFTTGGVPLLFPFSKKRYRLMKNKSGGKAEGLAFILACAFCVFVGLSLIVLRDTITRA